MEKKIETSNKLALGERRAGGEGAGGGELEEGGLYDICTEFCLQGKKKKFNKDAR